MRKIICKATGCCRLVDPSTGHKYCYEHQSLERDELERKKVFYPTARHNVWANLYNSPKWKVMRAQQLKEQPFCEICGAEATEVHHTIPHNGDPNIFFDSSILMSICHSCHTKETQKESEVRKQRHDKQIRKLWY